VRIVSVRPADESGFDRDTALEAGAGGELLGLISEAWRAAGGPHGGYVAALILRGLMMTIDDAARTPLTMTIQFVREPAFGPVQLQATVERSGRSLTSLSGRLVQGGSAVALVLASFGVEMPGPEYGELPMPEVEAPWDDRRSLIPEQAPRFVRNLVIQPRFGLPFQSRPDPMIAGGWTALPGRRPLDPLALALFTDTWWSPPYVRLDRVVPSPTITLSVYFRARVPRAGAEHEDLCLARFETRLVRDGCFQSDGVIWGQDGTVLAQSHQLQLLLTG
jgi:acyl-CoA thioesterase